MAQASATGFQGYRLEPPIQWVQEEWLAILRFNSQENLDAWLRSPARRAESFRPPRWTGSACRWQP